MKPLENKKIAILVTNGFEEEELTRPRKALEDAGATVEIVSPEDKEVKAWDHTDWGDTYEVDIRLSDADPNAYDALMLPGGVMNPDQLRMNEDAVKFARHFLEKKKPVAAICHAAQLLIETEMLTGKELTSYPSLQTDLENAGAHWSDREVVDHEGLVTSRSPKDMEAFTSAMIEKFS